MSRRSITLLALLLPQVIAATAGAQTLRLSLPEAIRMALSRGTQAALARSAAERASVSQPEALGPLLPPVEAPPQQYPPSLSL